MIKILKACAKKPELIYLVFENYIFDDNNVLDKLEKAKE